MIRPGTFYFWLLVAALTGSCADRHEADVIAQSRMGNVPVLADCDSLRTELTATRDSLAAERELRAEASAADSSLAEWFQALLAAMSERGGRQTFSVDPDSVKYHPQWVWPKSHLVRSAFPDSTWEGR